MKYFVECRFNPISPFPSITAHLHPSPVCPCLYLAFSRTPARAYTPSGLLLYFVQFEIRPITSSNCAVCSDLCFTCARRKCSRNARATSGGACTTDLVTFEYHKGNSHASTECTKPICLVEPDVDFYHCDGTLQWCFVCLWTPWKHDAHHSCDSRSSKVVFSPVFEVVPAKQGVHAPVIIPAHHHHITRQNS